MATKLFCDRCKKETSKLYQFECDKIKDQTYDTDCTEHNVSRELCETCMKQIWEVIRNV